MHWIESEDECGFPMWDGYVECSHWGLFLLRRENRWLVPVGWKKLLTSGVF